MTDELSALVLEQARALGFARAAIVPLDPPVPLERYRSWLDRGYGGEMAYLSEPEHLQLRADPRQLLPEAHSLIAVAMALDRADPALPTDLVPASRLRGKIARYARGEDYHMVLRDRLIALADRLREALGQPVLARSCVDAAPVLERAWAERAGLGFTAKNTMLIAPGLGSHVMLGELLVSLRLPPSTATPAPAAPRCGRCRSCLDACPTGAFVDAYLLDARRCISYLTIEHRGDIPRELRAAMGTWIFGCDICQDVCPFNAGRGGAPEPALAPRDLEHALPDLVALATGPTNQLRRFVKRTALRRVSREQLLRNVAVALGNSDDARAVPALLTLLPHRSPQVRAHAAWAVGRVGHLASPEATEALRARLSEETSAEVRLELELALEALA